MKSLEIPTLTLSHGDKTIKDETVSNVFEMPRLGLGTYKLLGDEAYDTTLAALKLGYRLIDTASQYDNEVAIGHAIRDSGVDRSEIVIATKLWQDSHEYDKVRPAALESLGRLGLEQIDLYLIHWPNPSEGKFVYTWQAMADLQHEGLLRAIGVCNFPPQLLDVLALPRPRQEQSGTYAYDTSRDWHPPLPLINQVELHPAFQQPGLDAYCKNKNIVVQAYSPLGGRKGAQRMLEHGTIKEIAAAHDKTTAQTILRWHTQEGRIVIPKTSRIEHLEENAASFDFELSLQEIAAINRMDENKRLGKDPLKWYREH